MAKTPGSRPPEPPKTPPPMPAKAGPAERGGFGKRRPDPVERPASGGIKRSHAIALGAGGVIMAAAFLGGGETTEPTEKAAIFSSVAECKNEGVLAPDVCEQQFNAASAAHVEKAPKFSSQSECEAQYGATNCWSRPFNGANVFVPAMVGFLVANHLSNSRQAQALMPPLRSATPCPPGQTPVTMPGCVVQPLQRTTSSSSGSTAAGWRSYSNASGYSVSRSTSRGGAISTVQRGASSAPSARSTLGGVSSRSATTSSSSSSTVSRGGFGSTARSSSS